MNPEDLRPVPSPCISLCGMGADGYCKGCLRTIEEIRRWREASEAEKGAVWKAIRQRQAQRHVD